MAIFKIKSLIYGLLLTIVISIFAIMLGEITFLKDMGISFLVIVIILGMVVGNTFYSKLKQEYDYGVNFVKHYFLRAGIIFYGFRLTLTQIAEVGVRGVVIDALMVITTFCLTFFIATKFFKLDNETSILVGSGASICGAAAVMATSSLISQNPNKVAVALATVVIFGTISIFIYPIIFHFLDTNNIRLLSENEFGIYIGSSVHEVAQVVAIGNVISPSIQNLAVIEKMIRVMMLAPFLMIISYFWQKNNTNSGKKAKIVIPWFAVFFIVIIFFNTLNLLPYYIVETIIKLDNFLLAMAMGALGITTNINSIKQAGIKPFLLGFIMFLWLIFGGLFINSF